MTEIQEYHHRIVEYRRKPPQPRERTVDEILDGIEDVFDIVIDMGGEIASGGQIAKVVLAGITDLMSIVPIPQPYGFAVRTGLKTVSFLVNIFIPDDRPTWQDEVREIIEKEVKDALNSTVQEIYGQKLETYDLWIKTYYLPWRDSGIADREKLAEQLYDQIQDQLFPAWSYFEGKPDGDGGDERFRDCMGLYLYATAYYMMSLQELYSLDVPSSFEEELEDSTDPWLRLELHTKLITNVVDRAHDFWQQWYEHYKGELFQMPSVELMGKRLELAYEIIHASDGQAIPISKYSLTKHQPDEITGTWTRQFWDRYDDCTSNNTKGHFAPWQFQTGRSSNNFEGITVYLPGTYVVKAYVQQHRREPRKLDYVSAQVRTSKSGQQINAGDVYEVGTEEDYPGGPPKPDVGAYRKAINEKVDLSAGDLLTLDLSFVNNTQPEDLNAVAFAVEMVRGQDFTLKSMSLYSQLRK